MSANGISTLATKQARQVAKLNLASLKRQGYTLSSTGTVVSGPDISKPFYRARNVYDITQLPTEYINNDVVDNPNTGGLIVGRPWAPFQVYTGLLFNYGEATISFKLTSGIFSDVTCPYGAGGYPYGPGVDPVLLMPGNQLAGGTSPANDIYWEYTAVGGVITGFTYRSGTPP
jgi:hypothetical protein